MRYRAVPKIMILFSCLAGFALMGCSGYVPKTVPSGQTSGVIYQVNEQQALDLVHWSMRQALPEQKIYKLAQPRVGLFVHETVRPGDLRWARFKESTYIYEVDLRQSQGIGPQGDRVTGYTFGLKGSGDLVTGPENLAAIERLLKQAFDQSGRPVSVTSASDFKPGPPMFPPEPSEVSAPGAATPDTAAPEGPVVEKPVPQITDDVFDKLKKLKELLDQGIITREEFETKKQELLDRI